MATYVAITTTNPQSGSRPVAHGADRREAENLARRIIGTNDIYAQTEQVNLRVVPISRLRGNARREMDRSLDTIQEVAHRIGCQTRYLRAVAGRENDTGAADAALGFLAAAIGWDRLDRDQVVYAISRLGSVSTELARYFDEEGARRRPGRAPVQPLVQN